MKGILPCTKDYFKTVQGLPTSINHKWPPATLPSSSRPTLAAGVMPFIDRPSLHGPLVALTPVG